MTENFLNSQKLDNYIKKIGELDKDAMRLAQIRLDSLTKPLGSLGKLEDIIVRLAGISGSTEPRIDHKAIIIMCADNGVFEENVSSCPKEVTATVTKNFTRGITGINVFCEMTGADIFVVDVGVDEDLTDFKGIIHKKIRRGTDNITKGPAMTIEEAIIAIETGIDMVAELKEKGYHLIGTGEMGIGNTTTSSAIASVLLDISPSIMVGNGAGLSKEGLLNKINVVERAIKFNKPIKADILDVISKVGGFDIVGLVGCFIGGAVHRLPIVIDGFISSVAALCAVDIEPKVKDYIFPSHASAEQAGYKILDALGLQPMLLLDMRLGEGTGAALAFNIFDAAFAAYTKMGTFGDAAIEQYKPQN